LAARRRKTVASHSHQEVWFVLRPF